MFANGLAHRLGQHGYHIPTDVYKESAREVFQLLISDPSPRRVPQRTQDLQLVFRHDCLCDPSSAISPCIQWCLTSAIIHTHEQATCACLLLMSFFRVLLILSSWCSFRSLAIPCRSCWNLYMYPSSGLPSAKVPVLFTAWTGDTC